MSLESITKGMKLTAAFGDGFFAAEVLEVSTSKKRAKAPIKVHYNGYGADEDAWVSLDQVKSKALKAPTKKGKKEAAPAKTETKKEASAPAEVDFSVLEKGTKLQALFTDDKWYAAAVVEVSKAKKKAKAPVKVHYNGYGDDEDAWLGADSLRCKLLKAKAPAKAAPEAKGAKATSTDKLEVGDKGMCKFAADGKMYKAEVIQVAKKPKNPETPYKVHYEGYEKAEDAWIGLADFKVKGAKKAAAKAAPAKAETKEAAPAAMDFSVLEKGTKLTALFTDGKWYGATVVEVSKAKKKAKAPVKVHYNGYGDDEDAWVGADGLRSKLLKAAPAKKEKEAPAKATDGAADFSVLEKGTKLTALFTDGKWYAAAVVEVSKAKKKAKAPVKVHFNGYGDDEDAWVGAEQLRCKLLTGGKAKDDKKTKDKKKTSVLVVAEKKHKTAQKAAAKVAKAAQAKAAAYKEANP